MTTPTEITLYTRPGCQPCKATKRKLDALGATYRVIDVTEHPDAADYVRSLGYNGVPVVVAGEDHWHGFSPDKLEWAVANATNP